MTHDLRLLAPAFAVWLTAATTIGLPPPVVYAVAAAFGGTSLYLLTTRGPTPPNHGTDPDPSRDPPGRRPRRVSTSPSEGRPRPVLPTIAKTQIRGAILLETCSTLPAVLIGPGGG